MKENVSVRYQNPIVNFPTNYTTSRSHLLPFLSPQDKEAASIKLKLKVLHFEKDTANTTN